MEILDEVASEDAVWGQVERLQPPERQAELRQVMRRYVAKLLDLGWVEPAFKVPKLSPLPPVPILLGSNFALLFAQCPFPPPPPPPPLLSHTHTHTPSLSFSLSLPPEFPPFLFLSSLFPCFIPWEEEGNVWTPNSWR